MSSKKCLPGPESYREFRETGPRNQNALKVKKKKVNARGETNLRNNVYNWGLRIKSYKSVCYLSGEREYKLASF